MPFYDLWPGYGADPILTVPESTRSISFMLCNIFSYTLFLVLAIDGKF